MQRTYSAHLTRVHRSGPRHTVDNDTTGAWAAAGPMTSVAMTEARMSAFKRSGAALQPEKARMRDMPMANESDWACGATF